MDKLPLEFRVLDELVQVNVEPLPQRIRLDQILPVLRALDDGVSSVAIRKSPEPVTCAKGCSACCKIQPVPVTPVEAYDLFLLVEAMPEPKRQEVLARFQDCVSRLEAAGLAAGYLEGRAAPSVEQAQANVRRYLDMGLVCPFLEDDCCSIYEHRPFTCRHYFVTSPKEFCVDPISLPIKRVPVLASGAKAILGPAVELNGIPGHTLPLNLALVFALAHGDSLSRTQPSGDVYALCLRTFVASSRQPG
jgi:Fe-S-cluster containining protein